VREALTQLSQEGFVDIVPNKGAVVTKLSVQDLKDYYALIALLEGKAVEWAVPNLNKRDIDMLMKISHRLESVISGAEEKSIQTWTRENLKFHHLFWEKSHNLKLLEHIQEIRLRILRYRYTSLMVLSFKEYLDDHNAIIEASLNKDVKKASEIMSQHIFRALDVLLIHFRRIGN